MKRLLFVGTKTIHLVCRTFRLASVKQQLPPPTVKCLEKSFLKPVFSPLPFSAFKIKTFSLHSAATTLPFTIFSFPLPWTSYVEGDEGSYWPKTEAVAFMKCQNNRDISWRTISKLAWQLGLCKHSPPSTIELNVSTLILCLSILMGQSYLCRYILSFSFPRFLTFLPSYLRR